MKRYLAVLLFVLVMTPSLSISQTINVSVTDWMMLKTELSISKEHLSNINKEVKNLEDNLEEARLEQQNSQTSIESSQEKIDDLERRLALAVQQRDQLQNIVDSLENRLAGLAKSLSDTKIILNDNEEKHIQDVLDLSQKYERKLLINKIFIGGLVTVVVVEAVILLIKSMVD